MSNKAKRQKGKQEILSWKFHEPDAALSSRTTKGEIWNYKHL